MTNLQETYCKDEETCFPFLSGTIDKNYYGVKLRLADMGTNALPQLAKICAKVPSFRNFYLDSVFDKNKKPVILELLNQSDSSLNFTTYCFQIGQFERFSDKIFYVITRKSLQPTKNELIETNKSVPDLQFSIDNKPQCNSMKLDGSPA